MIGSVRREETEFGSLMKQPDELGGSQTQSTYAVAADADCAYTRVKAGGAKIAMEIRGGNYGGRGFGCFDVEGHPWSFGSYDPWSHSLIDS